MPENKNNKKGRLTFYTPEEQNEILKECSKALENDSSIRSIKALAKIVSTMMPSRILGEWIIMPKTLSGWIKKKVIELEKAGKAKEVGIKQGNFDHLLQWAKENLRFEPVISRSYTENEKNNIFKESLYLIKDAELSINSVRELIKTLKDRKVITTLSCRIFWGWMNTEEDKYCKEGDQYNQAFIPLLKWSRRRKKPSKKSMNESIGHGNYSKEDEFDDKYTDYIDFRASNLRDDEENTMKAWILKHCYPKKYRNFENLLNVLENRQNKVSYSDVAIQLNIYVELLFQRVKSLLEAINNIDKGCQSYLDYIHNTIVSYYEAIARNEAITRYKNKDDKNDTELEDQMKRISTANNLRDRSRWALSIQAQIQHIKSQLDKLQKKDLHYTDEEKETLVQAFKRFRKNERLSSVQSCIKVRNESRRNASVSSLYKWENRLEGKRNASEKNRLRVRHAQQCEKSKTSNSENLSQASSQDTTRVSSGFEFFKLLQSKPIKYNNSRQNNKK